MKKQINHVRQPILPTLILAIVISVLIAGCRGQSSTIAGNSSATLSPAQIVERSVKLTEQGELNEFRRLLSAKYKVTYAPNSLGEKAFSPMGKVMQGFGGVKSMETIKEDVTGDNAEVTYTINYGNGTVVKNKRKLVLEDGWKLDGESELVN